MAGRTVKINRAPVLTLWAKVVSERLGYSTDEALSLAKALAGLNAQSKGRRLGLYEKPGEGEKAEARTPEARMVQVLGRPIPTVKTAAGVRAVIQGKEIEPEPVQRYLEQKFGEALPEVQETMEGLAKSYSQAALEAEGFSLYERFRPKVPEGKKGWGAKGELDLENIASLARTKD